MQALRFGFVNLPDMKKAISVILLSLYFCFFSGTTWAAYQADTDIACSAECKAVSGVSTDQTVAACAHNEATVTFLHSHLSSSVKVNVARLLQAQLPGRLSNNIFLCKATIRALSAPNFFLPANALFIMNRVLRL